MGVETCFPVEPGLIQTDFSFEQFPEHVDDEPLVIPLDQMKVIHHII